MKGMGCVYRNSREEIRFRYVSGRSRGLFQIASIASSRMVNDNKLYAKEGPPEQDAARSDDGGARFVTTTILSY
jgi:hypothetical protein